MNKDKFIYFFIRTITYPLKFLPLKFIHILGNFLGLIGFYLLTNYRKKTLSNLSLASSLNLSRKEILKISKQSFQNLAINCLEYAKFYYCKDLSKYLRCQNPEIAEKVQKKGKGIIFLCSHQANWEVLFLDGTTRMKGVAIGKPIKNRYLYQWILKIREKNGGKIITPRNAVFEGFRALKKGHFIGIVGDQGMPDSGYSSFFLGRRAWTSTAPALLSYKTGCPIIFATTVRCFGYYKITYSNPIWPDLTKPMENEVVTIMDKAMLLMEESITKNPGQWLWQHNRWKQQSLGNLYRKFRQDCLLIILPTNEDQFVKFASHLSTIREIYKNDFITLLIPSNQTDCFSKIFDEVIFYQNSKQLLLDDLRFKLVFDFTQNPAVKKHYQKLSAIDVLDYTNLQNLAMQHLDDSNKNNITEVLKRALCRPGSIWTKNS